jgi:hypothetical protein
MGSALGMPKVSTNVAVWCSAVLCLVVKAVAEMHHQRWTERVIVSRAGQSQVIISYTGSVGSDGGEKDRVIRRSVERTKREESMQQVLLVVVIVNAATPPNRISILALSDRPIYPSCLGRTRLEDTLSWLTKPLFSRVSLLC